MANTHITNVRSKKKFSNHILSQYDRALKIKITLINDELKYLTQEEALRIRSILLTNNISEKSPDYLFTLEAIKIEIAKLHHAIKEAENILNEKEYEIPENILSLAKEYLHLCYISKEKYTGLKNIIMQLMDKKDSYLNTTNLN